MHFLWFLIVGMAAGWLAGKLVKGRGFGLAGDLALGVVGALVGRALFSSLGLPSGGVLGGLIVATIGAVLLLYVVRLIQRP